MNERYSCWLGCLWCCELHATGAPSFFGIHETKDGAAAIADAKWRAWVKTWTTDRDEVAP
jgi:hypothetical protein